MAVSGMRADSDFDHCLYTDQYRHEPTIGHVAVALTSEVTERALLTLVQHQSAGLHVWRAVRPLALGGRGGGGARRVATGRRRRHAGRGAGRGRRGGGRQGRLTSHTPGAPSPAAAQGLRQLGGDVDVVVHQLLGRRQLWNVHTLHTQHGGQYRGSLQPFTQYAGNLGLVAPTEIIYWL